MIITHKSDPFLTANGFDSQITEGIYQERSASTGDNSDGTDPDDKDDKGGNFDPEAWGGFIGSVLSGAGDFAGAFTNNQNQQLPTNYTGGYNPIQTTTIPPKKDNTLLYVVIGFFGLLLLVGLFLIMRKKG